MGTARTELVIEMDEKAALAASAAHQRIERFGDRIIHECQGLLPPSYGCLAEKFDRGRADQHDTA